MKLITGTSGANYITNTVQGATIDALGGNDTIYNGDDYSEVSINAGAGNDSIYNEGNYVVIVGSSGKDTIRTYYADYSTINAGNDNDKILDDGSAYLSINGGSGADLISLKSVEGFIYRHTIKGGTGNDTIYSNSLASDSEGGSIYQYSSGDGKDKIIGFTAYDTLQIGGGNGSYSSQTSGSNVIVTVGEGKISLMGAASLGSALNIDGVKTEENSWRFDSTTGTATYGTTSNTLFKIKGVKSLEGLSLSEKVVTVSEASVNAKNITLTGTGYTLASNAKSITYSKATTPSTLATVKGAVSKTGLSVSGKKITLKKSALSSKVTISGGYEFDFASDYKNATITGSSSADSITARGTKISINAGKGNDTIKMYGSSMSVTGGNGADVFLYNKGNGVIRDYKEEDKISIASGTAAVTPSGNNVIFTIGSGKITVTNGADKTISYSDDTGDHTYSKASQSVNISDDGKKATLTEDYLDAKFNVSDYGTGLQTIDASAVKRDLEITGNALMNSILGGNGNDTLIGGGSNDTLFGGAGADVFFWSKGDGNDRITDYTDEDTVLISGDSIKSIKASSNKEDIIFTLASKSKITLEGGAYKIISYIDTTGEHVYSHFVDYKDGKSAKLKSGYAKKTFGSSDYSSYVDTLATINASAVPHAMSIVGGDIANSIMGTADEDTILGGGGKDTIRGNDGNDSLVGEAGNDKIYGGTGNDTLWGGSGSDSLWGGDGEDVFLYKPGESTDRIFDYNPQFDTIKLLSGQVDNVESAGSDIVFTIGTGKIILDNAAGSYSKVVDSNGNTLKEYFPRTRG